MYRRYFKAGPKLRLSTAGVVAEGLLGGCNFIVLYQVLQLIFEQNIVFDDIRKATAALAGLYVLRLALYAAAYTGSQTGGADVSRALRIAIGDKLKKIPLGLFTKKRSGFYINAATSEVGDYEQILTHKMADIVKFTILVAGLGICGCAIYLPVGIIMLVSLALLVPALQFSIHQVNRYGKDKNLAREENVSAITEYLTGSQVLRSYGLAGTKNRSLTESMKQYSDISYEYERAILPIGFVYVFFVYIGFAADIFLSAAAWERGAVTSAEMILLVMLPLFAAKVNMSLYISLVAYRNLLLSREKIGRIFGEKEEEFQSGEAFVPENQEIVFDRVDFSYEENEPVLKEISFTVPQRALTAIVGDSGSGKSTVFNLLAKYYRPENGRILIGGKDICGFFAEQVLSHISMVDQEVFLFDDTVRNNIRYARWEATDAEVEEACRLANCDGFIRQMEQGYDTIIGENGNRLSGGERQRLSIARAILRDSPVILLDEVTASLDIENELLVKQAVRHLLKADKTVIMIAHTLSIVQEADQILVLEHGKITECGTHEELKCAGGKYAAMWKAAQYVK